MSVALLLVAAYLMGSIPSSHLAGRAAGVDLTARGSGNLGGTNVFRVLGWKYALPVVVADVGKGFVPAWFFPAWDASAGLPLPGGTTVSLALAYGFCAIAGHVWSVFVGFDGGKGVATSGGVLLALAPLTVGIALLLWAGLAFLTRIVSVASLTAAAAVPVLAHVTAAPPETVAYGALLAALVWWTHRGNLARLVRGEELRFGEAGEEAPEAPGPAGGGEA